MVYEHVLVKAGPMKTMDKVWKVVCRSLLWCWRGVWPTEDPDGRPLRGPRAGTPMVGGYYLSL
eukprot:13633036-Alexandrium_andersonii.AAC.1